MFCAKYMILFLNLFYLSTAEPKVPVFYVQDYCHYTTLNHKIHLDESRPSIIIRASRGQYRPDQDCQLRIVNKGDKNSGLNINIVYINLRQYYKFKDYLVIKFDDRKTNLWFEQRLINNRFEREEFFFTTDSDNADEVVIKFLTTADNQNNARVDKDFEILVTLFEFEEIESKRSDNKKSDRSCERRYLFDCGNNICIDRKFFCDGLENCGNGWDEPDNCKHSRNNNYFDLFESGFWFGFKIVISLLLIGILLGIMSCICKQYDENKKLKKQLLLEELNRHSGYRLRGNSIYSLNQNKTPLYPQLYRTYGTDS